MFKKLQRRACNLGYAEEALTAHHEARRLQFLAELNDGQVAWIKRETKSAVDHSPGSRQGFIKTSTRLAHYKAEEEKLITEWLERSAYGEVVPSVDGGASE